MELYNLSSSWIILCLKIDVFLIVVFKSDNLKSPVRDDVMSLGVSQ